MRVDIVNGGGCIPASFKAISNDRTGPFTVGFEICSPLEEKPYPTTSAKIFAFLFSADSRLSSTTVAAPPLGIKPSRSLSKGLDAFSGSFSREETQITHQNYHGQRINFLGSPRDYRFLKTGFYEMISKSDCMGTAAQAALMVKFMPLSLKIVARFIVTVEFIV